MNPTFRTLGIYIRAYWSQGFSRFVGCKTHLKARLQSSKTRQNGNGCEKQDE